MNIVDPLIDTVIEHSRLVIIIFLLVTAALAVGIPMIDGESSIDQFEADTIESEKLDYVDAHFSGDANTTTTQIIVRDENVLTKETLTDQLEYQQALRDNETVNETLADERGLIGVSNLVAVTGVHEERAENLETRGDTLNETSEELYAALTDLRQNPDKSIGTAFDSVEENTSIEFTEDQYETFEEAAENLRAAENETQVEEAYQLGTQGVLEEEYEELEEDRQELEDGLDPSLDEQEEQLDAMNQSEIDAIIEAELDEDSHRADKRLMLMPTDYEPGSTEANATLILATVEGDGDTFGPGNAPDSIVDAELAMQDVADGQAGEVSYRVFGDGIITDEVDASMKESLLIVAPFALLFVLLVLILAYRDLLDIALGIFGIILVLVWTLGFMGWLDIAFNQIFIAVPVLLIGLSIDYAIHVFMRHREQRMEVGEDGGSRSTMRTALAGVGVALLFVTATTMIGFLSNVASPLQPIQEFGVVSAVGIFSAFLVFGALTPAMKVELDEWLEARGIDRRKRAFGTDGGATEKILVTGKVAAQKAPYAILLVALVLSAGGVYGATNIDTSFQTEDFIAEEPGDWTDELPDTLAPSEYTAEQSIDYLNNHFVRQDTEAEILIEGDITADDTLERIADSEETAAEQAVTATLSSGDAAITSPLSVMEEVAAANETFNETFVEADTTGDGVPDQNLGDVYNTLYEADSDQAETVLHRSDDEYEALRMVVSVDGDADGGTVTEEMREVADVLDGDGLTATATGQIILNSLTEDELFETVVQSLAVSLVAVLLFLMGAYRRMEGSASLGAVTLLPVVFTVTWILGTMYLLDIPFNIVTGMITSITIGLGVAYSIHMTERYTLELSRTESVWDAMETSITGTGGALLGSAATTAGGFGVLVVAFLPFLQEFGLITSLMIIYAFLASVFILPSLLALWTRFAGPQCTLNAFETLTPASAASEGLPGSRNPSQPSVDGAQGSDTPGARRDIVATNPVAVRYVEPRYARPGQTITVAVTVRADSDRVMLRERFDDERIEVGDISPEPVESVDRGDELYAVFELDGHGKRTVEYEATLPDTLDDGRHTLFDGAILAAFGHVDIKGDDTIEVVTDLFERIIATGDITETDVHVASEQFEAGELTDRQFELISRAWLQDPNRDSGPSLSGDISEVSHD